MIATVKSWSEDAGYGFLITDDGDVFVHRSKIMNGGPHPSLEVGQKVMFQIAQTPKGRAAYAVTIVETP